MITLSGVFSPGTTKISEPILNSPDTGGNASEYILIDEKDVVRDTIRWTVDSTYELLTDNPEGWPADYQYSETSALIQSRYGSKYKTDFITNKQREIIGFDAPQLTSIDRLTLRIRYKIFKKTDLFNWYPEIADDTFVIKTSNFYQPFSLYRMLMAVRFPVETLDDAKQYFVDNCTIPYIGRPTDIEALEDRLSTLEQYPSDYSLAGPRPILDYPYVLDDPAWFENYRTVKLEGIYQKQFYVILPCFFNIDQVWISVAGVDTDGNIVSDGLDSSGVPHTYDNCDSEIYKYIDMGSESTRSVYFSNISKIQKITVSGNDVGGDEIQPHLTFGDYNFQDNVFLTTIKEFWITDTGDYINSEGDKFDIFTGYDAVLSFVPEGEFLIRIYYTSSGFAVYQNIVGQDGVENPVTVTPDHNDDVTDWTWPTIPGLPSWDILWEEFLANVGYMLAALGAIAGIVGIGLLISFFASRRRKTN